VDYSGWRNSKQRPGLRALLDNRSSYSSVVVPKLSRFGRSLPDLVRLFETFDADGIALVFLDLGLDTSTSQRRLLRNMMAAVAEFESDVKSDYLRATHRHIAERGRPNGGQAPFGYRYDRALKNYVVLSDEAEVVLRRIALGRSDGPRTDFYSERVVDECHLEATESS
jgi:site-specific DNA recombinase